MLSSDKNVETIAQLIEAMKHYVGLQAEYVKLDVIEKVVRLLKAAALVVLFFVLILLIMLIASVGLAIWISRSIGLAAAFFAVAEHPENAETGRIAEPWIERPLVRALARLLMND